MKDANYKLNLFVLVGLLFISSCMAQQVDIVRDKKAETEIVISSRPSNLERKAALVLQEYIKRITGVPLAILSNPSGTKKHVVYIGNNFYQQRIGKKVGLGNEGFEISVRDGQVYLTGGSGKGLLYGVYELIEKQFGARKYDQGPAWVPRRSSLTLPQDFNLRFEPALRYRESYYPASADAEYLDWHHLHRFEDLWGLWGHSFFKIIPPEDYFQQHPEYFALTNGKRSATQLCLTNPDVQKIAINYFRRAIADNPDAVYWSIAPMDGKGYCTCDRCTKVDQEEGGPQGTLLRFVNRIAAQFPEQNFTTLAYGYTAEAPKITRPLDNVYVLLSTIDATRERGLAVNPTAAPFRRQLNDWSKISSHIFVWDYTTQFTAYINPFPMYDHYQSNIAYMYQNGVKGIFEHGPGHTQADMSAYASYLQAKILWNPELDQAEVEEDFLDGYYGAASKDIKKYLKQLIDARKTSRSTLDIYGNPILSRHGYLSLEKMRLFKELVNNAQKAVAGDPKFISRVKLIALGLEYAALEQSKAYGDHPFGFLNRKASGEWMVNPNWMTRIDEFLDHALRSGAIELAETDGSLEQYRQQWLTLLNKPYLPSLLQGIHPQFKPSFLEDFPANGKTTLNDGLSGTTDYSYNWLLFDSKDVEINFPFPNETMASQIQLNFLLDPAHYLFLPDGIAVESSEDNISYVNIGKYKIDTGLIAEGPICYPVSFDLKQQKGRFLKVKITFSQEFPHWFEGSKHRKPLFAIDEIHADQAD
ncbi:hypothetical protein BCY89_15270 [Sphingobacterium siyangense]|uniref:Alpha glucuronidase N-terminal domain-containing protein n=2 Tax=Sphingobacterium siyangense TaxID=459529 RepID=A0A420FHY3_9SPHI|nr:hypothetical protein BCY89_15270 [Sphingobacterium siyangense]